MREGAIGENHEQCEPSSKAENAADGFFQQAQKENINKGFSPCSYSSQTSARFTGAPFDSLHTVASGQRGRNRGFNVIAVVFHRKRIISAINHWGNVVDFTRYTIKIGDG